MTELEKMQREKMCIDKLANGIDPLTDNETEALFQILCKRTFMV